MSDPTALSYWFPKLEAAGLPVPATTLLVMPPTAAEFFRYLVHAETPPVGTEVPATEFCEAVATTGAAFGESYFLRTDHTSGKHNWRNTCFVDAGADVKQNVAEIVMYSELAGIMGLPYDRWAVREMLPTRVMGNCPFYAGMPLAREFRVFVEDAQVVCLHPYWPLEALERGGADVSLHEALCALPDETEVRALASAAGKAVGGAWSVDILDTERGWFITDMAEAHKSYHWPECQIVGAAA